MSPRALRLHLRARRVPAAAVGVAVVTLLAWRSGSWLMERPFLSDDQARIPVSALGTLVVAGVLTTTLGSPDEGLDRSTPTPWPWVRTAHVLAAALLGGGVLACAGLSRPELFGASTLARGVVGLVGLGALAATVVPARAAWVVVLSYASLVYVAAPREHGGAAAWWAWPMQPAAQTASFVAAGLLLAAGVVVHAVVGARATTDVE